MSEYRARFDTKYQLAESGCWEWTDAIKPPGYGKFWNGSRIENAHRQSWIYNRGTIPTGVYVCHHCDNRKCVNPDHLYLGTAKDNQADVIARNRRNYDHSRGKPSPSAILTDEQARQIFLMPGKQCDIARKFGVNYSTVNKIKTLKNFSRINGATQ